MAMDSRIERDLMRLVHGELPAGEARALRERLAREPELAARHRRLAAVWEGLELPPPSPVPPGFARRVATRAAAERRAEGRVAWSQAPRWARAAGALAMVAGLALGSWLGERGQAVPASGEGIEASGELAVGTAFEGSLAEDYWQALEQPGSATAAEEAP